MPRIRSGQISDYYVDECDGFIDKSKERLAALVSAWEDRQVANDEFTVCPSVSCASLVVLATLRSLGIKAIRFETPAYYGTVEQTRALRLTRQLIPTYRRRLYRISTEEALKTARQAPIALWISQPRVALGFDQSLEFLSTLLDQLAHRESYLVADEALDQSFPAHLSMLTRSPQNRHLIRIRSFVKGLGLNGLRLAFILHPPGIRPVVVNALEMLGGAVDVHSLLAVAALADDISHFQRLLNVAKEQVNDLRRDAERLVRGTAISVNPLTNGYFGSMVADLRQFGRTHAARREAFLAGCRAVRTPVVLGASFYLAIDPPTETVRLNYFMQRDNLLGGIMNVLGLWNPSAASDQIPERFSK